MLRLRGPRVRTPPSALSSLGRIPPPRGRGSGSPSRRRVGRRRRPQPRQAPPAGALPADRATLRRSRPVDIVVNARPSAARGALRGALASGTTPSRALRSRAVSLAPDAARHEPPPRGSRVGAPRLLQGGDLALAAAGLPLRADLLRLRARGDRAARLPRGASGSRCGGLLRCHPFHRGRLRPGPLNNSWKSAYCSRPFSPWGSSSSGKASSPAKTAPRNAPGRRRRDPDGRRPRLRDGGAAPSPAPAARRRAAPLRPRRPIAARRGRGRGDDRPRRTTLVRATFSNRGARPRRRTCSSSTPTSRSSPLELVRQLPAPGARAPSRSSFRADPSSTTKVGAGALRRRADLRRARRPLPLLGRALSDHEGSAARDRLPLRRLDLGPRRRRTSLSRRDGPAQRVGAGGSRRATRRRPPALATSGGGFERARAEKLDEAEAWPLDAEGLRGPRGQLLPGRAPSGAARRPAVAAPSRCRTPTARRRAARHGRRSPAPGTLAGARVLRPEGRRGPRERRTSASSGPSTSAGTASSRGRCCGS